MKLNHFLFGTVAVLSMTSAASAADAIVAANPEPAEYVRVCDTFGKGYFYIPGTETCLAVGGYVRQDIRGGDLLGLDNTGDGKGDTWYYRSRFALRVATASDTEYGALKTFTETRIQNTNGTYSTKLYQGYIDLAGFRVGQDESSFITFSGKAGNVINDDLISWGSYETQLISYTFDAGNGFSALAALEDNAGTGVHDYVPNAVLGVKYKSDAFAFNVVGGYDEAKEDGAIKARLDAKMGALSVFLMGGYNTGDVQNYYATWKGDWAVWTGASYKLNDKMTANAQLSYDQAKQFAAVADVSFQLASGFAITPEVAFMRKDSGDNRWGGVVRFQRNF